MRTPLSLCTPRLSLYWQVIMWTCTLVRGFSPLGPLRTRGRQDITRSRQSRQEPTGIEGLFGYRPTRMEALTGCLFGKLVRKFLPTPASSSSAAKVVVMAVAAIFGLLSGPSSQAIARILTSLLSRASIISVWPPHFRQSSHLFVCSSINVFYTYERMFHLK